MYVYFLVYVYARSAALVVSDSATQGAVAARLLCPWDSPDKNTEWAAMPSSGDLPDPGMEPTSPASPALQADSLPLSSWGSHV